MSNRFERPGLGFLDLAVSRLKKVRTFLDEVDRIIDWAPIERLLRRKLRRNRDAMGNPSYPALSMFKVLLLQRWYNLSDRGPWRTAYLFVGLRDFPSSTTPPTPPPSAVSAIC